MLIRRTLAACLVAAPALLSGAEVVRMSIRVDSDSTAARLAGIHAERGMWEIFGWLTLALMLAWLGATLGLVEALRASRPTAAWVGGVIAVTGAVAFAMHQGQYVELNAVLASDPTYRDTAQRVGIAGTAMEDATVVLQLLGIWLGPVILTAAMTRAGLLSWWRFSCVPLWVVLFVFVGSISPVFALIHLILLPPFISVAQQLSHTDFTAEQPDPVALRAQHA
jgi:hypothetical protein